MKTEKFVRTLVLVIICILIIQVFLAMSVLMLSGDPNSKIGVIAAVLTMASIIILGLFLSKLFELFTGRNIGEVYNRLFFFNNKSLDHDNKKEFNGAKKNKILKIEDYVK